MRSTFKNNFLKIFQFNYWIPFGIINYSWTYPWQSPIKYFSIGWRFLNQRNRNCYWSTCGFLAFYLATNVKIHSKTARGKLFYPALFRTLFELIFGEVIIYFAPTKKNKKITSQKSFIRTNDAIELCMFSLVLHNKNICVFWSDAKVTRPDVVS